MPPTREIEIVEEIAQHLDDRYTRLRALGATDDEAAAGAWRDLDEPDALGRAIAPVEAAAPPQLPPPGAPRSGSWLGTVWQDLRYAVRSLRKSPGFSATVLLAVALSIGPVTAIVSVGNWLLWRPHPGVRDAASLGVVWSGQWSQRDAAVSYSPASVASDDLANIRSQARSITGIAGVEESTSSLSVPGGLPREVGTAVVSANFFDLLGVRLTAGRSFTPDDDRAPFGSPVVVISQGLAQSAFGSAAGALGKSIALNSQPFFVIGVAAPAFGGITNTGGIQAWVTGATWPYLNHARPRDEAFFSQFVVRAAPGRTFAEVESELDLLTPQLAEGVTPRVFAGLGLRPITRPGTGNIVHIMLAIGGMLLLLGVANLANLLIFRATSREHDIGIRKALGASRARLLQWQMTEAWLLSATGAIAGLGLAVFLKQLIEQLLFPAAPGASFTVPIDWRVLGFTMAIALGTGTLAALAPGWLLTRTRGLAALGRATVTLNRAPRLRGGLAVVQLALSLTLLIGALLMVSTLRNLRGIDLGFEPEGVTVATIELGQHGYDRRRALDYHRAVLPSLDTSPEFAEVSLAVRAPFGSTTLVAVMPPGGNREAAIRVPANGVSESYFRLLSIPIVRGRAFTQDEIFDTSGTWPLIVNETFARQMFGTVEVLGRTLRFASNGVSPEQDAVIVGIARDSRWRSIAGAPEPFLYQPFAQFRLGGPRGVYLIKSALPAHRAGEVANAIAARTAPDIPLAAPRPLTSGIDRELRDERTFAWMLSLLAILGFALAAFGVYGLVAQATAERRREFGIRVALGAARRDVVRLVASHAIAVSSMGVLIGLSLAYFGTRVIQNLLFGVSRLDPVVYLAAIASLTLAVALACLGPAVQAFRVQAVEILRAE